MEIVENKISIEKYLSYKDSGVEWLEQVPEHWELKRFKHIFKEKKITHNVALNCGSISFGKVVYKDDEKVPVSTKKSYQVLNKGEFLINPLNLNYDLISLRIGLSDKDVVVSSGYIIVQNVTELSKDYYKWLLHIFDICFMKTLGSGVRQTLSFTHIANSELVFPPLTEQTAIAQFLDDKTTKIEEAILIKEQQISLLKERKQILIHKLVTQGLNPNVKLKDSGVEWIGEIPAHWDVKRFRYVFNLGKGLTITKENLREEGVFCVNYGEIHSKYGFELDTNIHKLKCVDEDYLLNNPNALINYGDFIFADTSEDIEGSGNFTYLESKDEIFAGYHTVVAKPKFDIESRFFAYEFESESFRNQIRTKVKGVKVYSITQSILKEPTLWYPPKEEQIEIVNFLDVETKKIETAVSLKQQEIEKLKEYKSSLINGVVTGKIKVC
jgi:type I restriction enzyme S subunit